MFLLQTFVQVGNCPGFYMFLPQLERQTQAVAWDQEVAETI